ncbi:DUF962-domain-containing protein [Pleurostoma richardsiae]|uniref:DUF962-domain-containing protein n=1 Tax=Pleurostoma richardsiae TaxID=41990 RepID=A0AA38VR11_9PEZI|nr:DUF962-domain-containing protein [Pleurostoma richardsiae]
MSLNLERQLTFYGAYHHNPVNVRIHMIFVPLILFSFFGFSANSGTIIPLPSWLTIPYLQLNLCTIFSLMWGGLYVLLEPVAGTALALICLGAAAVDNYLFSIAPWTFTKYALILHVFSWVAQFIGHGKFEGRAPALFDNIFQAFFLAPLFVWLELLFSLGYRAELQKRVEKAVAKEIEKFKAEKATKGTKAQ